MRGLLVGRFQPFHRGHLAIVREVRAARPDDELILGVGSAQESYTWKNPFTSGERLEMIHRALGEARLDRVIALPIPDIHRHALWVRYIETLLPRFERIYTNNPLTRALFEDAGYAVEGPKLVERATLEGAVVRARLASGTGWESLVPGAVAAYLTEIGAPTRLATLRGGAPTAEPGT